MARACITIMAALLLFVGLTGCQQQPVAVMPMPEASARDYFDAGMRAFSAGDYNQAASQFDGAIRLAPGMADAYWYLGMCYAKMGMAGRAADTYRSGLAVAPGHMGMHEALGLLSYAMNDYPQARRELGQAAALGSTNPQVYTYLGNLAMMDGDCPTALANYRRALAIDPGFQPARQEMASAQGRCRASAPRQAAPRVQKTFTGGGAAIDPGDF